MSEARRLVAAVLAAGRSERMGRPKALLPCPPGDGTFLSTLVASIVAGGLPDVLVVGRPDDDALRAAVSRLAPAASFVANPHAAQGQISSVLAAIDRVEQGDAAGLLVMPVDIPLVRPATIAAAVASFAAGRPLILRVNHQGRHGHPVIFGAGVFEELRRSGLAGANAVVRADPGRVLELDVDDPGVLHDVDGVAEYRTLFGRDPA